MPKLRLAIPLMILLSIGSARAIAGPVERFTAMAMSQYSPAARPVAVNIEIVIDRWSTPAERDRVIDTMKNKSPAALLDLLRAMPNIGSISTATSPGTSLRFAESKPAADGGRKIIIATERPMSVADTGTRRGRRNADANYPFSVVEIELDKQGNGTGSVHYSSRLVHNAKTGAIEVESYSNEPVRLTSVRPAGSP
jgi:hypothetical protein